MVLRHLPENVGVDRTTKATGMGASEVIQEPDSFVNRGWLSFCPYDKRPCSPGRREQP